ncbi:MAG TPA: GGDEF domain-containing protein [Rhodospirillaceae bacterium]|nr:GGDEF domain-containing protein [Rhodospirillaceae bacterium]
MVDGLYRTFSARVKGAFGVVRQGCDKFLRSKELRQFRQLLVAGDELSFVERRRAQLINSRVRLVAGLFALLTPLWIPIDFLVFPVRLAAYFAVLRIATTVLFGALVIVAGSMRSSTSRHRLLASLLAIPTVFFLVSQPMLAEYAIQGQLARTVAAGYAFLPFVMLAGLAMFPISAIEGACYSLLLIGAYLMMALHGYQVMAFETHLGALWFMGLLATVATLSGMSQLRFLQQWIEQDAHDGLTQAYTRRVGEELLKMLFQQSHRNRSPLSLVFVDLDDFKQINDRHGHEEGDRALRQAGLSLQTILRQADMLIRWGGEEFIIVMPNTELRGVAVVLQRLVELGFGRRPDGDPLTASIGGAERIADHCGHWSELVEIADQRMYAAKLAGKNRVVLHSDGG